MKLNVDGLLRGDYQSRMAGYSVGRQNGWLSTNDIREMEDMNPIPAEEGGDLYLVNGNLCRLEDAGLFAGKDLQEQEPPGVMFSRMAVTNSLLSKLVPKETEKRVPVEQLEKRLGLLRH